MTYEKSPAPWAHYGPRTSATDNDSLTRVDRDPCVKCGVRGDLGCKHRRAR